MNKKYNSIKVFLFSSFAFFIPVNQRISTIILVILVFFSILSFKKDKLNLKVGYLYPIFVYLLYVISLLYSSELQFGIIEQKASLLVFPIIFILTGRCFYNINSVLKYFIFGCLIALLVCELNALYNSFDYSKLLLDSRVSEDVNFYDSILNEKNYFFSYNFSFLHQTVYFAMYLLLALVVLLYNKNIIRNNYLRITLILFFTLGVLQTLNKAAVIVLFCIVSVYIFSFIKNKKRAVLSVCCSLFIGVVVVLLNPRFTALKDSLKERKYEIKEENFKKIKNTEPNRRNYRVMLWSSAIDLIEQNPIIGIGAGGSHNRLYEVFAVKRQWYYSKEKYHAHNQYLQILLDIGILGFIPFLLIFKELGNHIKNDSVIISFILIIGINFLFESMFERYSGISFFSFFYCLFISMNYLNYNKCTSKTSAA